MLLRLRYIGKTDSKFTKDKVYYAEFQQFDDLSVLIRAGIRSVTYDGLEQFLEYFKILGKDKRLARARINN